MIMKVKDLIRELLERDGDGDVFVFWNAPEGYYNDAVELTVDGVFTTEEEKWTTLNCSEK